MTEQTNTEEMKSKLATLKRLPRICCDFVRNNKFVTAAVGTAAAAMLYGAVDGLQTMDTISKYYTSFWLFVAAAGSYMGYMITKDLMLPSRRYYLKNTVILGAAFGLCYGVSLKCEDEIRNQKTANTLAIQAADNQNMEYIGASVCAGKPFDTIETKYKRIMPNGWTTETVDETRELGFDFIGREGSDYVVRLKFMNSGEKARQQVMAFSRNGSGQCVPKKFNID